MNQWSFRCECGQEHGPFNSRAEAERTYAEMQKQSWRDECKMIGEPESYDLAVPVAMFVAKPEIPPHFNQSLGMHIESRKHLEAMQEQLGVTDVVVTGKGERYVPRDYQKQHTDAVDRLEKNDELARHATPVEDGLELEEMTHVEAEA